MAGDRDLNDIEVFIRVVEERSFTGAGKRLGMPRSTVSRRIAELERRLGARLLHRTTRKLRLTDLGARYFERCSKGLTVIEEAEACVFAANETPRGKVRMTAPFSLEKRLGPAIGEFLRAYPDVQIEVELTQRMVDLIEDNFDLAIRATGHLPDSTLIARQLASGPAGLYASRQYLKASGTPNTPQELDGHAIVAFGVQRHTWTLHDKAGAAVEVPIRPRLTVNGPSLALSAVDAGFGITMLPFDFTAGATRKLVRVLPRYEGYRATLWLVYPSAKLMSATLRALRDHLLTYFANTDVITAA